MAEPEPAGASASPSAPFDLRDWARRNRNPLIFVGVGALVVLTIGYRGWRTAFEDLPEVARVGRVQGLAALDEGRFDTAHQLLSRAKRAAEALHDEVEGASEIHQGADEAAIFASLSSDSLEAILADAASRDPAEWPARFKTFYQGRSIIVDAHIAAVPGEKGSTSYELDYRVLPAGGAVGGRPPSVASLDTTGFALLERLKPKVGDPVRFGARLASFRFDSAGEEWRIGLVPDSGVQMLHTKALESLGWPSEETPTAEARP